MAMKNIPRVSPFSWPTLTLLSLPYKSDAELSLHSSLPELASLSSSPRSPSLVHCSSPEVAVHHRSSPELAPPEPARRRGPLPASLARLTSLPSHLHLPAQARTKVEDNPKLICVFSKYF
jgi:hypothetical protein